MAGGVSRLGISGCCVVLVTGCGVIYTSPQVRDQAAVADFRVVDVTFDTVQGANRSTYRPRTLPAYFYQVAGGGTPNIPDVPPAPETPDPSRIKAALSPPPPVAPPPFRIGIGDVVVLATKTNSTSVEQLSGLLATQNQRKGYTVRDDGTILVPDVGPVRIAGLSIQEAEDQVFEALLANQIDPTFSLEVSQFCSQRVVVGGVVGNDCAA